MPQISSAHCMELEWCTSISVFLLLLIWERAYRSPTPLSYWCVESPAEKVSVTEIPWELCPHHRLQPYSLSVPNLAFSDVSKL